VTVLASCRNCRTNVVTARPAARSDPGEQQNGSRPSIYEVLRREARPSGASSTTTPINTLTKHCAGRLGVGLKHPSPRWCDDLPCCWASFSAAARSLRHASRHHSAIFHACHEFNSARGHQRDRRDRRDRCDRCRPCPRRPAQPDICWDPS